MNTSAFVAQLLRHAHATPAVSAAHALTGPAGDAWVWLRVPEGFAHRAADWVAGAGAVAWVEPAGAEITIVTLDGALLHLRLVSGTGGLPDGAQPVFEREAVGALPSGGGPAAPASLEDGLTRAAGGFWLGLYRALGAVGQGEPFAAHGHLEGCRVQLLALYRLALGGAGPAQGWDGLDANPALAGLADWLVAPLDVRAQWRCAQRLAAAYERLVLPLVERLELAYPWAMRNLAFQRLAEVKPGQAPAGQVDPPTPAPDPAPSRPPGPARFRIKSRRSEGE